MKTLTYREGIFYDMPNSVYHAQLPHEDHWYSSSQLKDILEDPEIFHRKYIEQTMEKEDNDNFEVGTYFHTAILEPKTLEKACAVFEGPKRAGKQWESFQEENKNKTIITLKGKMEADNLINATLASPIAMELINREGTKKEVSVFVVLDGVKIKVRFDVLYLSKEYSYGLDLKSTRGNPKNEYKIKDTLARYSYELPAALYIRAINEHIKRNDLPYAPIKDFYWVFASKDQALCRTWISTPDVLKVGNAKIDKAFELLKKYEGQGWVFYDELGEADLPQWSKDEWLKGGAHRTNKYPTKAEFNNFNPKDSDLL